MLILARKIGEKVIIDVAGVKIEVVVVDIDRNKIRLGFDAPRSVQIMRQELLPYTTGDGDEPKKEV